MSLLLVVVLVLLVLLLLLLVVLLLLQVVVVLAAAAIAILLCWRPRARPMLVFVCFPARLFARALPPAMSALSYSTIVTSLTFTHDTNLDSAA